MPIQRNHSRRRRVFLDESVQSEIAQPAVGKPSKPGTTRSASPKIYADAAKHEEQLKITDLIPQKNFLIASIITGCLLFVGLLNYLAINAASWAEVLSNNAIQTISFSGSGSLAAWFTSFLLLLTSTASLQIYSMRRHRNDDYRGTYRIWLWLAVLFVVASVSCVVDFKSVFHSLTVTAGYPLLGRNILWLLGIKLIALSLIVFRGLLEVQQSRSATVAVGLAWIAYSFALVAQYPFEQNSLSQYQNIFLGNSILAGTISCFAVTVFFARFIYLHANEMVEIKPVVNKAAEATAKKTSSRAQVTKPQSAGKAAPKPIQSPAPAKKVAASTQAAAKPTPVPNKSAQRKSNESSKESQEILSLEARQEISKSERRRLKKLQKRQQRAA